jgi:hypothetical protein
MANSVAKFRLERPFSMALRSGIPMKMWDQSRNFDSHYDRGIRHCGEHHSQETRGNVRPRSQLPAFIGGNALPENLDSDVHWDKIF